MLQFGNGSWDYSDKVTFNLGKADGSKDLDSYLKKNAGIKNVRFEDYLSQDKTMTVKIKLDTDILDKTFEDEELNAFVVETKALMQNEKVWDKADVFNRAGNPLSRTVGDSYERRSQRGVVQGLLLSDV